MIEIRESLQGIKGDCLLVDGKCPEDTEDGRWHIELSLPEPVTQEMRDWLSQMQLGKVSLSLELKEYSCRL